MSYIDITDDDFYDFMEEKYSKYKIPASKPTLEKICFPKKFEYQIPQKFVADFINPKTPYKGLLIFHKIGAGKTCAAVNICEKFKKVAKIIIVAPAALKNNFRGELRSQCADEHYLTDSERNLLKKYHPSDPRFHEIIEKSNERINKYYSIKSYNKFISQLKDGDLKLANTLVVIDEIHNMVSEEGTYYETIYKAFHAAPSSMRLVIMTATPIFDKPLEIALTMNLLIRDKDNELPIGSEFYDTFLEIKKTKKDLKFKMKNMDLFKSYIKGYISYYSGAPDIAFPKSELHIVKCEMSDYQFKTYNRIKTKATDDVSNSFYIGTRLASNFVTSNDKQNLEGFTKMKDSDFNMDNLQTYSPKFRKILKKILKCDGTVFVYSNFKEFGGIQVFARMLECHKFKDYARHGAGKKRFAIWSGDTDDLLKDEIKNVFNNKNNEFGSEIKVILGSPAASTGVSFFRVQQVHIIDPYWNWSKMDQIIGRALRFCSHKDVVLDRRLVKIFIYLSVHPKLKNSVDQHILDIAIIKQHIAKEFEKAIKEAAIDCQLFKNDNDRPGSIIRCDT